MSDITLFLDQLADGDEHAAERLLDVVYAELRTLAAAKLAREAPGHTLQPTALVHEAWLRLAGDEPRDWKSRRYFFGACAEAMRRILIERGRRRARPKHGGDRERVELEDVAAERPEIVADLRTRLDAVIAAELPEAPHSPSEAQRRRLRALGYAE